MHESVVVNHLRPIWEQNEKANEPFIKHMVGELISNNEPALVVGAGYGYEEAMQKVITHWSWKSGQRLPHQRCMPAIFCTDKAHPGVLKLGRHPDYVLSVNTEETKDVKLREWYDGVGRFSKLILPVTAHPSHVRIWTDLGGGEIYWMIPENTDFELANGWAEKYQFPMLQRGSNSGEFAWMMANILGHDPIGLIGMPYAWKTLKEVLDSQSKEWFEYHHFCTNGKNCYTTLSFMEQRTEFLELIKTYSVNRTFNLTEGGILYDASILKRMNIDDFLKEFV